MLLWKKILMSTKDTEGDLKISDHLWNEKKPCYIRERRDSYAQFAQKNAKHLVITI